MSNEGQDPKPITVSDLRDAIARAEVWLEIVKKGLATLPQDTPVALGEDDKALKALRALQPDFPYEC